MLIKDIYSVIDTMILKNSDLIIGIDGRCGAGKTTLADILEEKYNATVFHTDDFYLQKHQRTEGRLLEIGGNIDYERFENEVINKLIFKENILYRPFDCKIMDFPKSGECIKRYSNISVIEGSYSLHPRFVKIYDLKIFLDITVERQQTRLFIREGADKLQEYNKKWIPKEKAYFNKFKIKENSDIIAII